MAFDQLRERHRRPWQDRIERRERLIEVRGAGNDEASASCHLFHFTRLVGVGFERLPEYASLDKGLRDLERVA